MSNQQNTDPKTVTLSAEQQQLFEQLEHSSDHIFVTGKAGTGKSLLLQYFKLHSMKKLVVVAPTGVAAITVGGQTIHSLFRIPPSFIAAGTARLDKNVSKLLKSLDTVVIDEISMVRADLMDAIDHLLRKARGNEQPFGGVQMILFGDLFQLPPVVNDQELHRYFLEHHGGFYFFNAHVWQKAELEIVELSHIFRQKDKYFKELLNMVRKGNIDYMLLSELNERAKTPAPTSGSITLAATNFSANQINETALAALPGDVFEFKAKISGALEQSAFPTEEVLRLKKGAQIMMLKNDKDRRWGNGTLGTIHSVSAKLLEVNINGTTYTVTPETWSKIRYTYNQEKQQVEEEVVSAFTQLPIRLAWGITIHKSQGQTYQSVIIDMGRGAFTHGQTYVALSRCVSLEHLYLKQAITKRDIIVDIQVVTFMSKATILKTSELSALS